LIRSVAMAHIHRDDAEERGGFNFDNVRRNEMLRGSGLAFKNAMKTGTTISGVCFAGGVVLGADTRSTNGETVADKNCEKIHYIAPNIYCCGAGTAADTEAVTGTNDRSASGARDRRHALPI
jgi:20S proteasome subunit beta 2